jgi:hypothetical protein
MGRGYRAAGLRVWMVGRGMGTVRLWIWGEPAGCRVWRFDPAVDWGLRPGRVREAGSAVAWIGQGLRRLGEECRGSLEL